MLNMKKAIAASVLATALLVPSIAEAKNMMPMTPKSGAMMDKNMTMNTDNLVPLRMFAETLGYKIMWNMADRSITLTYMRKDMGTDMDMGTSTDTNTGMGTEKGMTDQASMMSGTYAIKMMLGSKSIMVGMDTMMLEQAPMLMDGKVYISKEVVTKYLLTPFMMMSK